MGKEQALKDLKKVLRIRGYHSDEISETDIEKANRERRERNQDISDDNDRVVKVLDKRWRSRKVRTKYQYYG